MQEMSWSFANIWNKGVGTRPDRPLKERDYIWASELGGSYLERSLRMKGVVPTNPANLRSHRKFDAGVIWEWVVGIVLKRAGVIPQAEYKQERVTFQYPGLLEVSGRPDYLAGGKIDWEGSRVAAIQWLNFMFDVIPAEDEEEEAEKEATHELLLRMTNNLHDELSSQYPDGLKKTILEIKSSSLFTYELRERVGKPDEHHALQAFHYLKAKGMDEAHVVYISKDDCRLLEFGVMNPSYLEDVYHNDIEMMTKIIRGEVEAKKEEELIFDPDTCKFRSNWRVRYSPYLTMLYGYKYPEEFEDKYKKQIPQWNRTLGRCAKGDKMTPLNLQTISEIKQVFANFDDLVEKAKKAPVTEEGDEVL